MASKSKSIIPQNEVQQIIDSRLAAILEKELQEGSAARQGGGKPSGKRAKSDSNDSK